MQRHIQQIDAAAAEKLARKVLATSTLAEIAGLLDIPHSSPAFLPPSVESLRAEVRFLRTR